MKPNPSSWRTSPGSQGQRIRGPERRAGESVPPPRRPAGARQLLKRHPAAAAGIGDLYAADKNWERAVAEYTKAITPETKDAKLLAKRAEAYEKLKQWDLAVADWTRASQQQPDVAFERFKPAGAESWQFDLVEWRSRFDGGCRWDFGLHNDGRDRNQLARSGLPGPVATGEWSRVRHPFQDEIT